MKTFVSDISQKSYPISERVSGEIIRPSIMELIKEEHPDFDNNKFLSIKELNLYREKYVTGFLGKEIKELSELESRVVASIQGNTSLTDELEDKKDSTDLTVGQRIADKVASFGGSWTFILSFLFFLLAWIALNAFWLANKGFDPYPFILLNLILSCLAALQAPIIMMSQNRQEEKDRDRAKKDYMINLKSEIEIRALHEKIDHLMIYQQQKLIEIQKDQIDMMNDILNQVQKKHPKE
ncbi:MAG: DUF1003 domain-containing protein [Dysgonomonas sp.]|nr:DUF1003 domain-containing protein [Dysgonomonas sp.]